LIDERLFGMSYPELDSSQGYRRWEKMELIGRGAFGVVHRAWLIDEGLTLAAKQIAISGDLAGSKNGDASLLSALSELIMMQSLPEHQNIIRLHSHQIEEPSDGFSSKKLTIFMDFAMGGSVASVVKRTGPMEEVVVRTFIRQILQGLAFLHSHGVVHRDIKGGNILLAGAAGEVVKLGDFGTAMAIVGTQGKLVIPGTETLRSKPGPTLCACLPWLQGARNPELPAFPVRPLPSSPTEGDVRLQLVGTPKYMAPEVVAQLPGDGRAADIWALGCTLIEMFSGELPWGSYKLCTTLYRSPCPSLLPNRHPPLTIHDNPPALQETALNFNSCGSNY